MTSKACYKPLLRASRQWRNLKLRKWSGFGHGRGNIGQGDLALRCPACPQPGINIPNDWDKDPDKCGRLRFSCALIHIHAIHRFKYMASIVMDGNFSAQNRKMKNPHDDVPLADGHGFMVTTGPFRAYLQEAGRRKMPVSAPLNPQALATKRLLDSRSRSRLLATTIGPS